MKEKQRKFHKKCYVTMFLAIARVILRKVNENKFKNVTSKIVKILTESFNLAKWIANLKVPSGHIGSAWEWHHWIGLKKDINRYSFWFVKFWSWIFQKSSKFWAASFKNDSNLLLVGITVCLESFLPMGCHTFICWKNSPKGCSILVWIADC